VLVAIESRAPVGPHVADARPLACRLAGAVRLVDGIDLSMVKLKLMDANEGPGWSADYADHVERRYRRYLCMIYLRPDRSIVPTQDIDSFWHQHILDTRAYAGDCEEVFGEFLHHFPYFGMRGEADAQDLLASYEKTKELYADLFGEPYCVVDGQGRAGKCVKCGSGPNKCHHPPTPTRCR
jgi:hypothetical protein